MDNGEYIATGFLHVLGFVHMHSREINAAASQSGYTIKPHYLPAIDEQKETGLKVCHARETICDIIFIIILFCILINWVAA